MLKFIWPLAIRHWSSSMKQWLIRESHLVERNFYCFLSPNLPSSFVFRFAVFSKLIQNIRRFLYYLCPRADTLIVQNFPPFLRGLKILSTLFDILLKYFHYCPLNLFVYCSVFYIINTYLIFFLNSKFCVPKFFLNTRKLHRNDFTKKDTSGEMSLQNFKANGSFKFFWIPISWFHQIWIKLSNTSHSILELHCLLHQTWANLKTLENHFKKSFSIWM